MNDKITALMTAIGDYTTLVSSWTTQSHKLWISSTPEDVIVKTFDTNGNLVDVTIPNVAKVTGGHLYSGNDTINVSTALELKSAISSLKDKHIAVPITILLSDGVYLMDEPLVINSSGTNENKRINIESVSGLVDNVIIRTSSDFHLLVVNGAEVNLKNITLDGDLKHRTGAVAARGVLVNSSGTVECVEDVTIKEFETGVYCVTGSFARCDNIRINNCHRGCAVGVGSTLSVRNSIVHGDSSTNSVGIFANRGFVDAHDIKVDYFEQGLALVSSSFNTESCDIKSTLIGIYSVGSSISLGGTNTISCTNASGSKAIFLKKGSTCTVTKLIINNADYAISLLTSFIESGSVRVVNCVTAVSNSDSHSYTAKMQIEAITTLVTGSNGGVTGINELEMKAGTVTCSLDRHSQSTISRSTKIGAGTFQLRLTVHSLSSVYMVHGTGIVTYTNIAANALSISGFISLPNAPVSISTTNFSTL